MNDYYGPRSTFWLSRAIRLVATGNQWSWPMKSFQDRFHRMNSKNLELQSSRHLQETVNIPTWCHLDRLHHVWDLTQFSEEVSTDRLVFLHSYTSPDYNMREAPGLLLHIGLDHRLNKVRSLDTLTRLMRDFTMQETPDNLATRPILYTVFWHSDRMPDYTM